MTAEEIRDAKLKVEQDMQYLRQQFGDVSNNPCTLNIGQKKSGLYLSTQQTDLLLQPTNKSLEEAITSKELVVIVSSLGLI